MVKNTNYSSRGPEFRLWSHSAPNCLYFQLYMDLLPLASINTIHTHTHLKNSNSRKKNYEICRKQMDLKTILLNKVTQTQKYIQCMFSLMQYGCWNENDPIDSYLNTQSLALVKGKCSPLSYRQAQNTQRDLGQDIILFPKGHTLVTYFP